MRRRHHLMSPLISRMATYSELQGDTFYRVAYWCVLASVDSRYAMLCMPLCMLHLHT
jgi:hypothetical protein